ncbi:Uncharacterized protein MCB1EB_1638 [Mycoavidus cysteinexigens]|uniref:Uncharacterized protein n=1 Tax=Mycoavidus cysteinexigens TaxID=1553431 RepID=A0A2Z6EWH6_9BURK|nr:phage major capsid protein [Mycoavidus cysteinexigens]BBE09799.1 Uncharacterized protein MCB1EB_1638 [Mycoavidus cysteinexigens]GLR01700.1 hypothetical protein GCM10007934_15120 [Mycoavidus cysteinexigens]
MPISQADLAELAKVSLDEYLRNIPVDNIGTEHPFLKKLLSKRKSFMGAKQNIVENVRKEYGSGFKWAYGAEPVVFNKRNTTESAAFPWRRAVDGLYLEHDRLFGNGIKVREGKRGAHKLEQNEKVQLINLLNEQMEALRLGFLERLDIELHRDGTSSADAITGLDAIIATKPTTGIIGGINRATATYWRNYADLTLDTTAEGDLSGKLEKAWRACIRNGGSPNFILAGSDFIDAYKQEITLTQNADAAKPKTVDLGIGTATSTGLFYKGIEIIWDPIFQTLDTLETPETQWEKRCYLLNTRYLKYSDDDMDIVTPTRPHDTLALYTMVNLRCALSTDRSNAHAVLAIK